MSRAAKIDSAYRRTNSLFSKGIQQKGKSAWKPRLHAREYNPGVPMDIGYIENQAPGPSKGPRLTQAEENGRKENQLCFNCGKAGHISKDCQSPKNLRATATTVRLTSVILFYFYLIHTYFRSKHLTNRKLDPNREDLPQNWVAETKERVVEIHAMQAVTNRARRPLHEGKEHRDLEAEGLQGATAVKEPEAGSTDKLWQTAWVKHQ